MAKESECLNIKLIISIIDNQVSDPDWEDLAYFARLIPRVCHNINRLNNNSEDLFVMITL